MLDSSEFENNMSRNGAAEVRPVVFAEQDHPIRIQDIDKEALKVLYRLRDAGHAGYLVGGGVRDLYLGKQPKDFDISTDARPGQIRKLFRNSRTIGRRFRLVQVYFRGGKIIEVSTLRSQSEFDIENTDKVLPSNNTFGTLPEDAFRRDLTINSLFYEIENRTIIDYVGGVRDLDNRIIRIVGEPERRVVRDPVRMMRAVRHAARNDFQIEPRTSKAIRDNCAKLNLCPVSRIRDEIFKDLRSGRSGPWLRMAMEFGLFFTLFPFYTKFSGLQGESEQRDLLLALFHTFDTLTAEADPNGPLAKVPDHFLLAMLVMPWAIQKYNLLQPRCKKKAYFHLSRELRAGIDDIFSEKFNLKRMTKEAMVTLLVNLATFARHHQQKNWPKWLQKKSYFRECLCLYSLLADAQGICPADSELFVFTRPDSTPTQPSLRQNDNGRGRGNRGRRRTKPAFTNRKKGVFGLRKK